MRMAKTLQARLDKANCDYDIIPHPHSATSWSRPGRPACPPSGSPSQ